MYYFLTKETSLEYFTKAMIFLDQAHTVFVKHTRNIAVIKIIFLHGNCYPGGVSIGNMTCWCLLMKYFVLPYTNYISYDCLQFNYLEMFKMF